MKKNNLVAVLSIVLFLIPGMSHAMDTDLYTGKTVVVPPNVLIIFDTSGSMDDRVPDRTFDPTYDYSTEPGDTDYDNEKVYYWDNSQWGGDWEIFADHIADLDCDDAEITLNTFGRWSGNIHVESEGYGCSTNDDDFETLSTGTFINYNESDLTPSRRKIDVARDAIKSLLQSMIDDGENIRVGLMRFNTSNVGGRISVPIADLDAAQKALLDSALNGYTANGATPLAETLAEAGLYFANKSSWANPGVTYTSPIQWRCQQNHIILMTDGNSYYDEGGGGVGLNIFTRADYINGKTISDYDSDGADPGTDGHGGTHWLDDVAKFLYDEDMIISGNDPSGEPFEQYVRDPVSPVAPVGFERQNVHTHTIGFATGTNDLLLRRAAAGADSVHGSHGDGLYRASYSTEEIQTAFEDIFGSIIEKNVNLSAPVVPISEIDNNYSGRNLYVGMFRPNDSPFWYGNIKKYVLDKFGNVLQKDGTSPATDASGVILSNASSCYPDSNQDGFAVDEGGVGAALLTQNGRNFYTYHTGSATTTNLTDSSNRFHETNNDVRTELGVADPDDLIYFLSARNDYDPDDGAETKKRAWVLGDLLHSKPSIQDINGTTQALIFVGANDGFLHCFIDDDKGNNEGVSPVYTDDEVEEAWSFVPWEQISKMHTIKDPEANHEIFIDGSPVIYPSGSDMLLTFGLRRGGDKYHTLDIGTVATVDEDTVYTGGYDSPAWKWEIASTFLGTETLGQSWCTPQVGNMYVGGSVKTAVFLSGGYDALEDDDHYDDAVPAKTPNAADTRGRAVYAVDASDGSLLSSTLNYHHSNYALMTHSIVDILVFDSDHDTNNLLDTVYAGDMGGNLFVFSDRNATGAAWNRQLLFKARDGVTADSWLKFFYRPAVKAESWGEYVFIGTGDRETPDDLHTENFFYGIKNRWEGTTLVWSDLTNVSSNNYDNTFRSLLKSDASKGWFIKFDREGEKVVSYPILYEYRDPSLILHSIVIFTTFTPDPAGSDLCNMEVFGGARIYGLDYLTGEQGFDLNGDGIVDINDKDTNGDGVIDSNDQRSIYIGLGMPSAPQIVELKDEDDGTTIRTKLIVTAADHPSDPDDPSGNSGNSDDIATTFPTDIDLPDNTTVVPVPTIRYWKQN